MNEPEAFQLLTLASARDGRTVSQSVAAVWAADLWDVSFDDGDAALRTHFRESPGTYLAPGHIIAQVKRQRQGQADTTPAKWRELMSGERKPAPKPHNLKAMTAAWNNPEQFAIETEKYNDQLRAAGFEPVAVGGA